MVDERIMQLVIKLHDNTKRKRISWSATPYGNAFETSFPQYSVRLGEVEGRQGQTDYATTIINDQGIAVDSFSDEDLTEAFAGSSPDESWFHFMGQIYEMARRQALGADQAIDAILGGLE